MKKIYIVFNDKEKRYVSTTLFSNLKYVFGDYVKLITCFLDEIEPEDIADGDLFLVLYDDRVYAMKEYISSLDKVIVVSRTVQKKYMTEIFSIPDGTDVLVVNDSDESTIETANNLYQLGLNHLNLIPYVSTRDRRDYRGVKIAITPNEAMRVPDFIKTVVDIDDRYLDTATFMKIISRLGIRSETIVGNLIKYSQLIAEPGSSSNRRYVEERLKNEMLKSVVKGAPEAVILTNRTYHVEYANDKARAVFGPALTEGVCLRDLLRERFVAVMGRKDYESELFRFDDTNYMVSKTAIRMVDQVVGYSVIFNDERDIKNIGENLNQKLAKSGLVAKYSFDRVLHSSPAMNKCIERAQKVAPTDYTILITGESGTGKELMAQSIHNYSRRKNYPFVAINCAALPESLLESELFGYEKGAFTGASANGKLGLFEQASKGTVFLDEIGDMSLNLQARLLRVLQEKQVMRLGSDRMISVDIRIIAATNRDLPRAVQEGTFREDLYYRLCNIPIQLPPLRERKGDVLHLFRAFLGDQYEELTPAERESLERYRWPGNIRELRNAADYYLALGELPVTMGAAAEVEEEPVKEKSLTLRDRVLNMIRDNTSEHSGIGRTAILYRLREENVNVSDDRLRKLLSELADEGEITVGRGRTGCMACR